MASALLFATLLLHLALATAVVRTENTDKGLPLAHTKNGTYAGRHSLAYNQDFFLGLPFAQPPVGDLRFRLPQSLNSSFEHIKQAQEYSPECVGYGGDDIGYQVAEDCLYLNVIRPAAAADGKDLLPVAVWIYGGGYQMGGTVDRRYNLSFIVENSAQIGKPMLGVSINYRLSFWGFPYSDEVQGTGNTNLGLRDQRLALHWIKENIAAFGGDPNKVTIWGESAGASSVGFQLVAYNGRDDGLFRGAIMESGNPVPYNALNGSQFYQPLYDNITKNAGCGDSADSLGCLRSAPFDKLNAAINTTHAGDWFPVVDGDFIARYPSIQLHEGAFVHVPIISGANTDEGTSFSPTGVNTTDDLRAFIASTSPNVTPGLIDQLLEAYPDDPCVGIPADLGCTRLGPPYGAQYRRAAAFGGDFVFIANRRQTCAAWAGAGVPAYCYRFNARPYNLTVFTGVTHFQEVAFVFNNTAGLGYAVDPFEGRPQSFFGLSVLMSRSWAGFVVDQDPNAWRAGQGNVPEWPVYNVKKPQDFVFDANRTSYAEDDTFRAEGIRLINENSLAFKR